MKYRISLAAIAAVFAPTFAHAWDAIVCNHSEHAVSIKFPVAAANSFTLEVPAHSDSPPRSVAGLCFQNSLTAKITDENPQRSFSIPVTGWGACSNFLVRVFDGHDGTVYATGLRTISGISEQSCNTPQ